MCFSILTLPHTGTRADRESQWFAWVHELEEKSANSEYSFFLNQSITDNKIVKCKGRYFIFTNVQEVGDL